MRSFLFVFMAFTLAICSCDMMVGENDPNQVRLTISDTKEGRELHVEEGCSLIPEDKQQALIIIDDVDTAIYVVEEGDTLALCDAVYHDPAQPWGNGKAVVVVKDNEAHLFIIIQDRDGALTIQKSALPKDAVASLVDLSTTEFGVRNMQFSDGSSKDFDSEDTSAE